MAAALDAEQFTRQLSQTDTLSALYVLMGDEPLLVTEAGDALRAAARKAGHAERQTFVMDARSDWSALLAETQSVSLFGDKRIVEVKLPGGKPGKVGGDTLVRLTQDFHRNTSQSDTILIVHLPRLDKATRDAKWAQALTSSGVVVDIPAIDRARLPAWIGQRLARQKQKAHPESLQWMADKVEGNLLAAFQEIQKLALLYPEGEISPDELERAVLDVARYDVFGLRDAMLTGDATRTVRMLEGLRAEGEALPLVLWAVGEEIRILARIAQARQDGQDIQGLMRRLRVFGAHEKLALQALGRVAPNSWPAAVQHAHDVDRLIKGIQVPGRLNDAWEEMIRLALRVAAARGDGERVR